MSARDDSDEVVLAERADVLAILDRRIGNHSKVETNAGSGSQERAGWLRRELQVVRGEIANGLHVGEAQMAAERAALSND